MAFTREDRNLMRRSWREQARLAQSPEYNSSAELRMAVELLRQVTNRLEEVNAPKTHRPR